MSAPPDSANPGSKDSRSRFRQESTHEIAERTRHGVLAPFLVTLLLVFAIPEVREGSRLPDLTLGAMLVIGLVRLWLCTRGDALRRARPRLWLGLFDGAALASATVWTILAVAVLRAKGLDRAASLVLIGSAGMAAGATATISIRLKLFRSYVALMLAPLIVLCLLRGETLGKAVALLVLLFLAFLFVAGAQQNRTYWRGLADRSLLDQRAAELEQRIGERERAEAALRDSDTRTRVIIETALDGVISTDDRGVIEEWNSRAQTIFGYSREEAIGRPLADLTMPEARREEHDAAMSEIRDTGEGKDLNVRVEHTAVDRAGRRFPVETAIAVSNVGGRRLIHCFVRDISDRKRWEDELKAARDAALESARMKSEFLANMSHEIRTPMNGILGMTDLALETELTEEQTDYLKTVQSSTRALMVVINDILDFSKIEAGRLDLETIPFQFRDMLGEALKTVAVGAQQKGLEFVCDVDPDAPERLSGDPGRLRQVLLNLLSNAIKFTARGEVVLRIRQERREADATTLRFSVIDSGIGIPAEKRKVIFDAFTQADGSTTRNYGGSGLGLAIASQLVAKMGGSLEVDSRIGVGSTFWFTVTLPVAAESAAEQTILPRANLAGLSVAVVDDNATNRRTLKGMLDRWGMKTTSFEDAASALAAVRQSARGGSRFDLALLDLQMPDMDGFTLAREILEDPASAALPILLLTSVGQRGDAARCREVGIAAYLTKPIMPADLHRALQTVCGLPADQRKDRLVTRHTIREGSRLRVLLAEDNAVNRMVAVKLLGKRGHDVVAVENGEQALAAIERQRFDLVLMDVQMPVMDGLAATMVIRTREQGTGRRLPIVALTAHAMRGDEKRCLDAGMDAYLSKPIDKDALYRTLEELGAAAAPARVPAA